VSEARADPLRGCKAALFVLLAVNAALYAARGTAFEALDSLAWLLLLALFALETGRPRLADRARALVRALRLAAAAAIAAAALGYAREGEALDAANSALWIAVVIVLELKVRLARAAARGRAAFAALAGSLYLGLAALAAVRFARGEWFDGYDAALWLLAFAAIELDVLRLAASRREHAGRIAARAAGAGLER
jgi:hypothetical protein